MINWIPITKQLPEFEKTVLLYWEWSTKDGKDYKSYETGYLTEVRTRKSIEGVTNYPEFHVGDDYNSTKPTHWAELNPPTE